MQTVHAGVVLGCASQPLYGAESDRGIIHLETRPALFRQRVNSSADA